MDARLVDISANMTISLIDSKKRIDILDLQLSWRPIYAILSKELFPKQRKTGLTNISSTLLSLTEYTQRFFPPHEIPAMLQEFLPRLSSTLNSILATQAFFVHFLPTSHPQYYFNVVFTLWESFNSNIWDEQWLDLMERLSVKHLNPVESNPEMVELLRIIAREKGELVGDEGVRVEDLGNTTSTEATNGEDVKMEENSTSPKEEEGEWKGIRKDIGIYTEAQFGFIMTKCLRSMGTFTSFRPSSLSLQN